MIVVQHYAREVAPTQHKNKSDEAKNERMCQVSDDRRHRMETFDLSSVTGLKQKHKTRRPNQDEDPPTSSDCGRQPREDRCSGADAHY